MKDEFSPEELNSAIDNIARTADGRTLYLWLQKTLMGVPTSNKPGALQADRGRRMFAAELMGLMSPGMAENTVDRHPSARPIVFAVRAPASTGSRRSAREYLASTEPGGG